LGIRPQLSPVALSRFTVAWLTK